MWNDFDILEKQDETELFTVTAVGQDMRIDRYLSDLLQEYSRSYVQKLISEDCVKVDGKSIKSNYRLSEGECIRYQLPPLKDLLIEPENIPLDVVYEDSDVILINKPKGMVVHPAAGHSSGTLVNALMYHCGSDLSGINGNLRPGIVHRIDMDTTGIMIACKNDKAHRSLAEQLKEHSITRIYQALVYQSLKDSSGTIDAPIGRHPTDRKKMAVNQKNGRRAITHYTLIENLSKKYAHISCSLETGRTHQIRVHMASFHHPLLGDSVYGPKQSAFHLTGQTLHAQVFGFVHPSTREYMEFNAELPTYFSKLIDTLRES